jgi:hypothetical protein
MHWRRDSPTHRAKFGTEREFSSHSLFALDGTSAPTQTEAVTRRSAGSSESALASSPSQRNSSEEQRKQREFTPASPGLSNCQISRPTVLSLKAKQRDCSREFASGSAIVDPLEKDKGQGDRRPTIRASIDELHLGEEPDRRSFWERTTPPEEHMPGQWKTESIYPLGETSDEFESDPTRVAPGSKHGSSKRDREMDQPEESVKIPRGSYPDPALAKARRRNDLRLRKANEADWTVISKYLPSNACMFFPFSIEGPDDFYRVSEDWVDEVIKLSRAHCPTPKAPLVQLGSTPEALDHNTQFLKDCGWDFEEVFAKHKGTTVDHGSEFRTPESLHRVLGSHPYFSHLSHMLQEGFAYHLSRELSEDERAGELAAQIVRGNHKSATESEGEVQALLEGDVRHGFVLPVWEDALLKVKGCHLQPGGMVRQFSLKADGTRKIKNRFTHDLSYSISLEDASINSRVEMNRYPDMVYGWCFQRILHYLSALRARNPGKRIFISKFDYSDAYKRISQCPRATAATVVRFGRIAYFCWRMVFGGSPNPAGFSCFSELLTDLANEIAMSKYGPEMGTSPTVEDSHLIPREQEDPKMKVCESIPAAFSVSTRVTSQRDCFIDDIIDCHLDTPSDMMRAPHIVQLAVQAISRPHAGDEAEPVPRRPLLGPDKLEAEGRSSEIQVILGWEIRTRPFVVALPFDKHRAWREDLDLLITTKRGTQQELESMIGRLNHASHVIPLSRHFLNEVRAKCLSVPRKKGQHIRFTDDEKGDLELWRKFLDIAKAGISINLLVFRTPTRIAWSDSCPFGLGGYTLSGFAWRIRVPKDCPFYGDDTVNNVLEFLGMAISVLLLLREAKREGEQFPCLLVLGDNTSAISWLFKSGKIARSSRYYPVVKSIARHLALSVTEGQAQLCSQHLAGTSNSIADLLSFEGRCRSSTNPVTIDCPPDDVLTLRIHQLHHQIIPDGFNILPLPTEIESFALSTMRIIAKSWSREQSRQTSESTGTGEDGSHSQESGDWGVTHGSIQYPKTVSDCSWEGVSSCTAEPTTLTERVELIQSVRNKWYRRLLEMPLAAWHRRLGNVEGQAPSTSRTESMVEDRSIPEFDHC